jgi:hypothetical protein
MTERTVMVKTKLGEAGERRKSQGNRNEKHKSGAEKLG